jgi:uncharacterized protein
MYQPRLHLIALTFLLALTGSGPAAAAPSGHPAIRTGGPRLPRSVVYHPLVRQQTPATCGVASLTSVLYRFERYERGERPLAHELHSNPSFGTNVQDIVRVARAHGLTASWREHLRLSDVRRYLGQGYSIIVELQAWRGPASKAQPWRKVEDDGHYVVLMGMDRKNAYFMDPAVAGKYAYVPLKELRERWHGWLNFKDGGYRRLRSLGVLIHGPRGERPDPRDILERMD